MGGKQWPLGTVAMVTVAGQCNVTVAAVTSAGYRTAGVSESDLSRTHTHTFIECVTVRLSFAILVFALLLR